MLAFAHTMRPLRHIEHEVTSKGVCKGTSRTIAAMLHTSVLAPHFAPKMTSGERYWRVWISFVKWCETQQAFPKSAILTLIIGPPLFLFFFSAVVPAGLVVDLSREMPDTSFVKISLCSPDIVSIETSAAV